MGEGGHISTYDYLCPISDACFKSSSSTATKTVKPEHIVDVGIACFLLCHDQSTWVMTMLWKMMHHKWVQQTTGWWTAGRSLLWTVVQEKVSLGSARQHVRGLKMYLPHLPAHIDGIGDWVTTGTLVQQLVSGLLVVAFTSTMWSAQAIAKQFWLFLKHVKKSS